MAFITYLIVQAAAAVQPAMVPAPPAPPAPPYRVAPPLVTVPIPIAAPAYPGPVRIHTLDLRLTAGELLLYEGALRVGPGQSQVRREQTEPGPAPCGTGGWAGQVTNAADIRLMPTYSRGDTGELTVSVTVRWTRPSTGPCEVRAGSRLSEMTETVLVPTGRVVTIAGDAGLRLTLRRR